MRISMLWLGIVCCFTGNSLAQTFVDVTVESNILHNAEAPNGPNAPTFAQVQAGGAAAGDFDGDGWVDLFVTRYFDTDVLYRNNGDGTFSDVTEQVFDGGIGDWETSGACFGDIDNDGDLDLAVSTLNEFRHRLYVNDGTGRFSEEGESRNLIIAGGLPITAGTSFSMGDYDRDGFLDLYVTEWRNFSTTSDAVHARLFRNLGSTNPGHFEDVTFSAGVTMDITSGLHTGKGLSFTPRFVDFDRDGNTDIGVASDGRTSRLFWNNGDGTFEDGTEAAGIDGGTNDMGFTIGDFNGDGLMDWFVTSIGQGTGVPPSGNRLYLNNGDRTFTDATDTGVREGGWGWGTEAFDFDHDGDLDIVMTNGMTLVADDRSYLFENVGTREIPEFIDRSEALGIVDTGQGRGLLTFDYDRDGDLDVFIYNYNSAPILYRNDAKNENAWIQVRAISSRSNRDGIGAFITVTPNLDQPQVKYVTEMDGSSNYLAQSETVAHFGLGSIQSIDRLSVLWPSGTKQVLFDQPINQLLVIEEPSFDGDVNQDGSLSLLDVGPFVQSLQSGTYQFEADINKDGIIDHLDINPFIALLAGD